MMLIKFKFANTSFCKSSDSDNSLYHLHKINNVSNFSLQSLKLYTQILPLSTEEVLNTFSDEHTIREFSQKEIDGKQNNA